MIGFFVFIFDQKKFNPQEINRLPWKPFFGNGVCFKASMKKEITYKDADKLDIIGSVVVFVIFFFALIYTLTEHFFTK